MKKLLMFALFAIIATTLAADEKVKYVFLFVGDGYGYNQRNITEIINDSKLEMSKLPIYTMTGTLNAYGKVTDSAASGTAIACGVKTYNSSMGLDLDGKPLESISSKLKKRGFKIGIISSSHLTDATPGAHYAHQAKRSMFDEIGADLAASGFEFFGGAEVKGKNTHKLMTEAGYAIITEKDDVGNGLKNEKVYLHSQPYTAWPNDEKSDLKRYTLADYTQMAIDKFKSNPEGFFVMIENGNTDYAGHANDIGWAYREIMALDEALKTALEFQKKYPEETLVILTADHETGGLEVREELDRKKLMILTAQKTDVNNAIKQIGEMFKNELKNDEIINSIELILNTEGKFKFTPEERTVLNADIDKMRAKPNASKLVKKAFTMRDKSIGLEYTTGGHSDKRVVTNVKGPGEEFFCDPLENSDIGNLIQMIVIGDNADYRTSRARAVNEYKAVKPYRDSSKKTDELSFEVVPDGVFKSRVGDKTFTVGWPDASKDIKLAVTKGNDFYLFEYENASKARPYLVKAATKTKFDGKTFSIYNSYATGKFFTNKTDNAVWQGNDLADSFVYMIAPREKSNLVFTEKMPSLPDGKTPAVHDIKTTRDAYNAIAKTPDPSFAVPVLEELPVIDGNESDNVWKNIPATVFKGADATKAPAQNITLKAGVDKEYKNMYVFMNIEDDNIISKATERDSAVYDDDCVEFFFGSKGSKTYYHFIVNPDGIVYDSKKGDAKWNLENYASASVKTDKSWTLEIKIPLEAFDFKNFPIGNISVMDKPKGGISTLSYNDGDFHNLDAFIPFCFGNP